MSRLIALVFLAALALPTLASAGPRIGTVDEYFETLDARFEPSEAKRLEAVIQWNIQGAGSWFAVINRGSVRVIRGSYDEPSLTINVPASDYLAILNGEQDGKALFLSGRGTVSGSVLLAMRMKDVFPLEG